MREPVRGWVWASAGQVRRALCRLREVEQRAVGSAPKRGVELSSAGSLQRQERGEKERSGEDLLESVGDGLDQFPGAHAVLFDAATKGVGYSVSEEASFVAEASKEPRLGGAAGLSRAGQRQEG